MTDRKTHEREKYRRRRGLRYGVTSEELTEKIAAQEGRCRVCGSRPQLLHLDHDHQTNAFRGLLCHRCNTGIGLLGDDPERCLAAAAYLLGAKSVEDGDVGTPNASASKSLTLNEPPTL